MSDASSCECSAACDRKECQSEKARLLYYIQQLKHDIIEMEWRILIAERESEVLRNPNLELERLNKLEIALQTTATQDK